MNLYGRAQGPIQKPKYKKGDLVRILDYKRHTEELKKWNRLHPEEVKAEQESRRLPPTRDKDGNLVKGKIKPKPNIHLISAKNAPKFSDEVFRIQDVRLGHPIVYKLWSDEIEDVVMGVFYERELSHVLPE